MLLAIDTATRAMSLALHDGTSLLAEQTIYIGNHHTTALSPAIDAILKQCDVQMDDLTGLAVAIGPGSYTGVRIGVSLAKGLATYRQLPLVGVTTLDILAAGQSYYQGHALIALVSAGRGRVIVRSYRWRKGKWVSRVEPKILDWASLLESIDGPAYLTGEINEVGFEAIENAMNRDIPLHLVPPVNRLRRAGYLAEIAWEQLNNSDDDEFNPIQVTPIYLKSESAT